MVLSWLPILLKKGKPLVKAVPAVVIVTLLSFLGLIRNHCEKMNVDHKDGKKISSLIICPGSGTMTAMEAIQYLNATSYNKTKP